MPILARMLTVFTDGSCVPTGTDGRDGAALSGGHGGWAWWLSEEMHAVGHLEGATALRAEVTAVIEALHHPVLCTDEPLTVATDCHEVVQVMRRAALVGFSRWPWLPLSRDPHVDLEYWDELADLVLARPGPVEWVKVKGHAGVDGNVQADRLARMAAQALAFHLNPSVEDVVALTD